MRIDEATFNMLIHLFFSTLIKEGLPRGWVGGRGREMKTGKEVRTIYRGGNRKRKNGKIEKKKYLINLFF